ncbi:MAG TPA: hypothetical protein PK629_02105 [Oscillospiraceae bacterium]|nr:hypothetical protein [Oscillospiraceae bacterium]HPK35350.1 hypothetical protein [Oscillospiraceae bacterium]HPR74634.1 hypothetical protein [Oscillospiraceae bacterium]
MITRKQIINHLTEKLKPLPWCYAFWLEGADANGTLDKYSDIDFWLDVEDANEEDAYQAVENALSELSEIDYKYIMRHGHPKIRQRIYHLKDSSEYLMIDFCWQLHSRNPDECKYLKGSKVESAKALFDKVGLIQFVEPDLTLYQKQNESRIAEAEYRYTQHTRVEKYIRREQFLEAWAYYNRYVLEPLIDLLRVIYTPANTDYYLVHISHHIPKDKLEKLKYFAQNATLEAMDKKIPEAEAWFAELLKELDGQ